MQLTERQLHIMQAVITEYTETGLAVSSKIVLEKYPLKASPATVRAEMLALEQFGFLAQPHTSAGRIPTDAGYRLFVDTMMGERELTLQEQRNMQAELIKLKGQYQRLTKTTAKTLAALTENVAIAGTVSEHKQDIQEAGLRQLLEKPEFIGDSKNVVQVIEMLDYIDENIEELATQQAGSKEVTIYIGNENPCIQNAQSLSLVLSSYTTQDGEKGIVAILGPKRMEYQKNRSLVTHLAKLLGSGTMVVAAMITIL